jgi:hypothetical protein
MDQFTVGSIVAWVGAEAIPVPIQKWDPDEDSRRPRIMKRRRSMTPISLACGSVRACELTEAKRAR